MDISQMHQNNKNLPEQKIHDMTFGGAFQMQNTKSSRMLIAIISTVRATES
jgi:hypothetical protein